MESLLTNKELSVIKTAVE